MSFREKDEIRTRLNALAAHYETSGQHNKKQALAMVMHDVIESEVGAISVLARAQASQQMHNAKNDLYQCLLPCSVPVDSSVVNVLSNTPVETLIILSGKPNGNYKKATENILHINLSLLKLYKDRIDLINFPQGIRNVVLIASPRWLVEPAYELEKFFRFLLNKIPNSRIFFLCIWRYEEHGQALFTGTQS
ncbi:unnamed protein product [Bursaphelenchus okinawaensis]|uniref:Uncharacterized protein n=1 Tax=Bursaphelenchus okinawaensis TaxID=465554 RepID=A0A811L3R1_9BILA|nr:unnamed protein product [Bursaphelenchus okinawaensis]CAG9118694.1 unnamed protein product [Bursaphelenchus okinawaensis]